MATAVFNGTVLAESNDTIRIEGNHYFPPSSVNMDYFSEPTELHTVCHWKGEASYRNVKVGDQELKNVAWFYSSPDDSAKKRVGGDFTDYIAFYPQITVTD